MKKLLVIATLLLLATDMASAYNAPRDWADVLRRNMNSSSGAWLAKFGHVALYDRSINRVLEVTKGHGVIRNADVSKMMRNGYKGARYGKANTSQGYRALRAGYEQKRYRPKYVFSSYYTEGGWKHKWLWDRSRGFYQKWFYIRAKFRCDSFVNFCYKKGTGKLLVRQWTCLPYRVHHALPHRR